MSECVIRIVGGPVDGLYLLSFDFDARGGKGDGLFTTNVNSAMRFADAPEAMKFWRTISTVRPRRDDGEPNRPFTEFSIEVE